MYNGVPGHWSAWIVNSDGNRGQWGIIPSKYKVKTINTIISTGLIKERIIPLITDKTIILMIVGGRRSSIKA